MIFKFLSWLCRCSADIIIVLLGILVGVLDRAQGKRYNDTMCSKDCAFLSSAYDYLWKRHCRYYDLKLVTYNGKKEITCDADYRDDSPYPYDYRDTERFTTRRCVPCMHKGCVLSQE